MTFDASNYPGGNQPSNPWGGPSTPNPWGEAASPKPPVIPFRPLNLGDLFEGTFAAIRSNPKVMFTISLGTMAVFGVLSGIAAALVPQYEWEEVGRGQAGPDTVDLYLGSLGASDFLPGATSQWVLSLVSAGATLLVTGMLVLSVTNAVVGVNLNLRGTWDQLKPHFWRLIGTAILVGLIITALLIVVILVPIVVLTFALAAGGGESTFAWVLFALMIPVAIGLVIWLSVRLFFATMVVVVEGARPGQALARSWAVTKGAFWRTFGRLLLMQIVVAIAVSLISGAVGILVYLLASVTPLTVPQSP